MSRVVPVSAEYVVAGAPTTTPRWTEVTFTGDRSERLRTHFFGHLAAIAARLAVGDRVHLTGEVRERRFTDRSGDDRTTHELAWTELRPIVPEAAS